MKTIKGTPWVLVEIHLGQDSLAYWTAPCGIPGCKGMAEAKEWTPPKLLRNIGPRCFEHIRD